MAQPIKTYAYESLLPEFLTWNEWCLSELSSAELTVYQAEVNENDPISAEKQELFLRWVEDQRITTHICYEDGVEVVRFTFDQT